MPGKRTFTFLGTGTSVGVPMLGCDCSTCQSPNPKNQRTRCAGVIQTPRGRILIDTPPELRLQLLRARVPYVHALMMTHYHADHLFGLDDVRVFPRHIGGSLPIYCTEEVEAKIRSTFAYAFVDGVESLPFGILPRMRFVRIDEEPFELLGEQVTPIPLLHASFNVLGFRVGDLAYCTDVNQIPERSWPRLRGLDTLILDALRHKPHPAHLSLNEALEVIVELQPRRAYLTHLSHDLEHEETGRALPKNVQVAYDGLSIDF